MVFQWLNAPRSKLSPPAPAGSAPQPGGGACDEALRQLPRAVSVVTFQQGADWFGLTATAVSFLSVEPPTLLVSFDCAARLSLVATPQASFGVRRALAASHAEIALIVSGMGLWLRRGSDDFEEVGLRQPPPIVLRSDAVAPRSNVRAEEIIDRHGRAIVIGRIRNVFKIGGSGALVYWRLAAYDSIGWTDDEVRRAVGLFPAAR